MKERSFDEMIAYFNRRVSEMDIAQDYKMELLGMVTALGYKHEKTAQQWIPCSERLPDEEGYYLTAHSYMSGHIGYHVTHFAKDLYKVDEYDFAEWKGVSGFFTIDDEYGYEKVDALAWMPIEPWRGEEHEDD